MFDYKKVLINAGNLHAGGGVQVAVSFIYELSLIASFSHSYSVIASSEVDENLASLGADISVFSSYEVYDFNGLKSIFFFADRKFKEYDLIFTVFGPSYFLMKCCCHIFGFAQPWIVYPENELFRKLPFIEKVKVKLHFFLQSMFFKRADKLIVELDHVKKGLVSQEFFDQDKIYIVNNCLSSIYLEKDKWCPVDLEINNEFIVIGFVGRDYLHKNLSVLPYVCDIMENQFNLKVKFVVTLTEAEWHARDEKFKAIVKNVGPLTVAQCPTFYNKLDAVIFPSLLECFSATPIEAMAMRKPLFCSDRPFVRDACGEYANYFDPSDPENIAHIIADYFLEDSENNRRLLEDARDRALYFSNAKQRAVEYINIINESL